MENPVHCYLSKPALSISKTIFCILLLLGLSVASSPGRAQDGVDVTFEADTITVKQENNVMVAKGNIRVTYKGEILEAQGLTYDHSNRSARAMGEVKLKTSDGAEFQADELIR